MDEILILALEYGNTSFECGQWSEGDDCTYQSLSLACDKAKKELLDAIEGLGL